jgi:hypothetical protein
MMPMRKMVLAQNFSPAVTDAGNLTVFATTMPITIASMMSLIGLFSKPSNDSPSHRAATPATSETAIARPTPDHQYGLRIPAANDIGIYLS